MKTEYLGDALDHSKAFVLRHVQAISDDLVIAPMITDRRKWKPRHFLVYRTLLGIGSAPALLDRRFDEDGRQSYFGSLSDVADDTILFLDPDTGIKGTGRTDSTHVTFDDIDALLLPSPARVLVIYQHKTRTPSSSSDPNSVRSKRATLRRRGMTCFAYDSMNVATFVISREAGRVRSIHASIRGELGPVAARRLIPRTV